MENAPGSGGQQLWQHYVELWSHLLDFEPNLGQQGAVDSEADDISVELAPSDVGDVGINATKLRESMFDAVMHCVIKAMRELNLKYRVKVASSSSPPGIYYSFYLSFKSYWGSFSTFLFRTWGTSRNIGKLQGTMLFRVRVYMYWTYPCWYILSVLYDVIWGLQSFFLLRLYVSRHSETTKSLSLSTSL